LVDFLTRRRVQRVVAILPAYLALFASILFLGLVAGSPIVRQIDAGFGQLPADTIIWAHGPAANRSLSQPHTHEQVTSGWNAGFLVAV